MGFFNFIFILIKTLNISTAAVKEVTFFLSLVAQNLVVFSLLSDSGS